MKYIIEKVKSTDTTGELKNFWRISYIEYDTKYTFPKRFFTKVEATLEAKRIGF